MIRYEHLLGVPWNHGVNDCFTLARRFYKDNFGIELTNYARPDNWWHKGLNLYMDHLRDEGFEIIHEDNPRNWRVGDGLLMAIMAPVADHCAIYVGGGKIIHHFIDRLSNEERLRPLWLDTRVALVRHPQVRVEEVYEPFDITQDPRVRRKIEQWERRQKSS